jgi:hypothetical protein
MEGGMGMAGWGQPPADLGGTCGDRLARPESFRRLCVREPPSFFTNLQNPSKFILVVTDEYACPLRLSLSVSPNGRDLWGWSACHSIGTTASQDQGPPSQFEPNFDPHVVQPNASPNSDATSALMVRLPLISRHIDGPTRN